MEREPRFIRVTQFELNNINLPESDFVLHCSKGTYVRTIIHDLGEKIGCGGHLTALRRSKPTSFTSEMRRLSMNSRLWLMLI